MRRQRQCSEPSWGASTSEGHVCTHAAAFPALFITGQKPILKSKQGAFQIVDVVSMLRPITKFAKQVSQPSPHHGQCNMDMPAGGSLCSPLRIILLVVAHSALRPCLQVLGLAFLLVMTSW